MKRSSPRESPIASYRLSVFGLFTSVFVVTMLASGDDRLERRERKVPPRVTHPEAVPVETAIEGELGLCTQVIVPDRGVFVVLLAPQPENADAMEGYLAVWRELATGQLLIYGRPLNDRLDVGQSIVNLQRDLGVSSELLTVDSGTLGRRVAAVQRIAEDPTPWQPLTYRTLGWLMGSAWEPKTDGNDTEGDVALECPPEPPAASPNEQPCEGDAETPEEQFDRLVVAACGDPYTPPPCSGTCCGVNCNDGNSCTNDWCSNAHCYHSNLPGNPACGSDDNSCTDDFCSSGQCYHLRICPNSGDYCTNEYCVAGTCQVENLIYSQESMFFQVDCEGQLEDYEFTRSACATIPQGTDCVQLRVYFYSREWPQYTSVASEFNDTLRYDLSVPGAGPTGGWPYQLSLKDVNSFHSLFSAGPYPGGNLKIIDQTLHLDSFTQTGPEQIGMRATAMNIGDAALGSGVAYEITVNLVDLDYPGIAEAEELDPGGFLRLNDDDDNNNGIPDKDETGAVIGENDLVPVHLAFNDPGYTGNLDLSAPIGSSRVRFYAAPDRSGPISIGQSWQASQLPSTVYVEGIAASLAPRDVQLRMRKGASCKDVVNVTVYCPTTVVWQKADAPSTSLPNADLEPDTVNNGGVRIFPDWLHPNDEPPGLHPNLRQEVKLVATVTPAVAGVTVYFKVFDVDDPFDQSNPNMANVSLIDNNSTGPDNRPFPGEATWTRSAVTGENGQPPGKAAVTFIVSMQPGNNYRAGACTSQEAVDAATQAQADAAADKYVLDNPAGKPGNFEGYAAPLNWSKMLTVWRKLHVEVDSMDRESEALIPRFYDGFEQDECQVTSVIPGAPGSGFSVVQCALLNPQRVAYPGTDYYEGGAIRCGPAGQDVLIVRSSGIPISLLVWGDVSSIVPGNMCYIRDDDPYFGVGNPGQLPLTTLVDTNIVDAYKKGYIQVIELDPSLNLVNLVPWKSHLEFLDIVTQYNGLTGISSQWDIPSSDSYWARHFVYCYQSYNVESLDGDSFENCGVSLNCSAPPYPAGVLSSLPNLPSRLGFTLRTETLFDTALSTIYVETIRDDSVTVNRPLRWQIAAHEIGHITIDSHGEYFSEGSEHAEGGLMTDGASLANISSHRVFTAKTIARFRDVKRW